MSMTGFAQTCAAHSAGLNTLHLCKNSDITSMTLASSQDYFDTITMASTNVFTSYEFEEDQAEFSVESVRENGAQKHIIKIEIKLGKLTSATRTALQELYDESDCGMVGIATDSNGNKLVAGYSTTHGKTRPLRAESGTANTGKGLTDENGATLILTCQSAELPQFVTATIPV